MTNFEILTQKPFILEEFLEMVVDDALEAEGCSLDLKMPSEEWAGRSWRDWLEQEAAEDGTACETSRGTLYKIGEAPGFWGGALMDKEQTAIERLRAASEMSLKHYGTPLVVTTSGGKDSSICVALAERAGVPFEAMHNHTTVDAPETVRFVREDFRRLEEKGVKCTIDFPVYKSKRVTMWSLIPQKLMPPTRVVRYCCAILKERGGNGRFITTGVRWAESKKREGRGIYEIPHKDPTKRVFLNNDNDDRRRLFETCTIKAKRTCNPIIDWTDADVWDYIESEKLQVNPLYQCGFSRVGCVGCPMAGTAGRQREFARYPKYQAAYIRAFARMLEERKRKGRNHGIWDDGTMSAEDVFHWWMEDGVLPGQLTLEDFAELMEEDDDL